MNVNYLLMKKITLVILLCGLVSTVFAQTAPAETDSVAKPKPKKAFVDKISDGIKKATKPKKGAGTEDITAKNYLKISHTSDTTYVDTTLTIQKYYKLNYLRRDYFDLLPFANTGQTFNAMSFDTEHKQLMPLFGARAKHYNYLEVDDIYYYNVPTPFTELYYRSVFTQGQITNSFFTVNTSKQLNMSIGYKALRSLGKYQYQRTSVGNFWITASYKTKNKRYVLDAHFIGQDLMNQENGGLKKEEIQYFENGEKDYLDRGVFTPNFQNANNMLNGKRYYLQHAFNIVNKPSNVLALKHVISLKDKFYRYEQTAASPLFGDPFQWKQLRDVVKLESFSNKLQLQYRNKLLGRLAVNVGNTNYNYGYNRSLVLNGNYITNRLKGDITSAGATYANKIGRFYVGGDVGANISGAFKGNYLNAKAAIKIAEDINLEGELNHSSRSANYNALLYQSVYSAFNWQTDLKAVNTQQLSFKLKSKKLLNASVDAFTINNYTYFKQTDTLQTIKPFQSAKPITYLRLKANKELRLMNVALDNTVMYQKVTDDSKVLNLPQIIARSTLYYSNHVFKRAMYLQTGVSLNYFTKYYANAYNPVMAEFYVQNQQEIGDFPRIDFFLNGQIRNARIYLKAEHLNSRFTGFNYYSAPNYPYRDFVVRFGIVWNFFL